MKRRQRPDELPQVQRNARKYARMAAASMNKARAAHEAGDVETAWSALVCAAAWSAAARIRWRAWLDARRTVCALCGRLGCFDACPEVIGARDVA